MHEKNGGILVLVDLYLQGVKVAAVLVLGRVQATM
jgi:hypothetical protein